MKRNEPMVDGPQHFHNGPNGNVATITFHHNSQRPPLHPVNKIRRPSCLPPSSLHSQQQQRRAPPPPEIFQIDSSESLSLSLEPPHFNGFRSLLYSLILSTFLAVCAAFDAKMQCLALNNASQVNNEEEEGQQQEGQDAGYDQKTIRLITQECRDTFRLVILPVAATTFVLGSVALFIIHRHLHCIQSKQCSLVPSHLASLLQLLLPLVLIGASWTYGIYDIMLRPKLEDVWNSEFENPFVSLGAVTVDGHIGANANLYYLSWASEIFIMVLLYQVCVDSVRWLHRGLGPQEKVGDDPVIQPTPSFHEQIRAILSSTSASKLASFYRQRRKTWYQFLIRLRERSGYWVVAFFASLLVFASSSYLFVQVLVNLAQGIYGQNTFRYREVCDILEGNEELPEQYCKRTVFAILSGAIAAIFCIFGIVLHLIFRRGNAMDDQQICGEMEVAIHAAAILEPVSSNGSLKVEFFLSLVPSVLLGLNAVFATGVQGPAPEVGNLYYATFVSFFFTLRICLGCIEELRSIEAHTTENKLNSPGLMRRESVDVGNTTDSESSAASNSSFSVLYYDKFAMKERRSRLRRYLFLAILSTICAASAWDAAVNQEEEELSREQKYMMYAPIAVALVSIILFGMCLHPSSYSLASHLVYGSVLSLSLFLVWIINLLITMHSEDSWAVNAIGEIQMANLYYFSWGAILVAGMQMTSYVKPIFGQHDESDIFVLWAANIKVCMVILGASVHVWWNIANSCKEAELENYAFFEDLSETFCGRTKLGIGVAVTGILSGWLCTVSRVVGCPITERYRTRVETFLSVFLIIVFGAGVALLTGIGGPGQSVGDLFYSAWLAFVVSLAIFMASVDQLQKQEIANIQTSEIQNSKDTIQMGFISFNANDGSSVIA